VPPAGDGAGRVREALRGMAWTAESEAHMPRLDGLQQALPADRIVATNSTKVASTTHYYLSAEQPRSWLVSYGFATSAPPCRWPSVRSSRSPTDPSPRSAGDGGRLLTIAALGTAVDPLLPLPVLVYDNRSCGEIRDSFDRGAAPRAD
jgi:thiamine pyrophosphate-dependent acetolactate synthase large subunit-like protein